MERFSRELLCGLTYYDIINCAGMSQKDAAKKLGVNHAHFNRKLHKLGMCHWFPKPRQQFTQCITADDIRQVAAEGYIKKDAAEILGVSADWLGELVKRWDLGHLFPNCGKAAYIARTGYAN